MPSYMFRKMMDSSKMELDTFQPVDGICLVSVWLLVFLAEEKIYLHNPPFEGWFSLRGGESRTFREVASLILSTAVLRSGAGIRQWVCLLLPDVCVHEGKDCWVQPATAITADKDSCLCVDSRIQIHWLLMWDQPLFKLEVFKRFIESETKWWVIDTFVWFEVKMLHWFFKYVIGTWCSV